jgi:hypothetical protein
MADNPINDYYVVTSRRGQQPERWSWEILRKSKPLGIRMTGDGFQSDTAAQFAGKQALAEFLAELSKEEKRPRKLKAALSGRTYCSRSSPCANNAAKNQENQLSI